MTPHEPRRTISERREELTLNAESRDLDEP
jgi:hypothetical protein